MTIIKQLAYKICIVLLILHITACEDEEGNVLTEQEIAMQVLEGTWIVDDQLGITFNNNDVSGEFNGFEINIDNQLNYTTSGIDAGLSPWPVNGSFVFGDEINQLIRNDGLVITATPSNDGSSIMFSFIFNKENDNGSGGRGEAIIGEWLFNLVQL